MLFLNPVGRICVVVGIVAGLLAWFVLPLILGNDPRISGISSLFGMVATTVADLLYRVVSHGEKGVVRLVHSDYGGCYLLVPVWAVALMLSAGFGHWLFFGR
jgi:hypothetical protein